jgi:hypothetical protein
MSNYTVMGRFRTLIKKAPKKNKYKNHNITIDSILFASRGEAQRYLELKEMQKAGLIISFERQPKFEIQPRFTKNGKKWREITYSADFRITYPDGKQVIEDVKGKGGYTTPDFIIKQKLFEYKYPDLCLEIVQRSGKGMGYLDETQKPEVI